jgi:hypothetical protein
MLWERGTQKYGFWNTLPESDIYIFCANTLFLKMKAVGIAKISIFVSIYHHKPRKSGDLRTARGAQNLKNC